MPWSTIEFIAMVMGLGVITLVTRTLFLMPRREVALPVWLREALRYAPLAALMAIIAPEIALKDGAWLTTWQDAKLMGALASVAYFAWRRGLLGTIITGLGVFVAFRFGMGW